MFLYDITTLSRNIHSSGDWTPPKPSVHPPPLPSGPISCGALSRLTASPHSAAAASPHWQRPQKRRSAHIPGRRRGPVGPSVAGGALTGQPPRRTSPRRATKRARAGASCSLCRCQWRGVFVFYAGGGRGRRRAVPGATPCDGRPSRRDAPPTRHVCPAAHRARATADTVAEFCERDWVL